MNPDDLERLLGSLPPAPLPERIRRSVLDAARERTAQRRDLWRCAILAAAAVLMWTVVLGAMGASASTTGTATGDATALRARSSVPGFPGLPPVLRQQVQDCTATPSSAAQPPPLAIQQPPVRFPVARFEP